MPTLEEFTWSEIMLHFWIIKIKKGKLLNTPPWWKDKWYFCSPEGSIVSLLCSKSWLLRNHESDLLMWRFVLCLRYRRAIWPRPAFRWRHSAKPSSWTWNWTSEYMRLSSAAGNAMLEQAYNCCYVVLTSYNNDWEVRWNAVGAEGMSNVGRAFFEATVL